MHIWCWQHVCVFQAALMALASMTVCGVTTPVSTNGRRCRPCWRHASTTAPACWKVSCTWWRQTALNVTIMLWTVGRPCHPCCTQWTTAPPPRVADACMPLAVWLGRTPWPSRATMQTPTAGPGSTVDSCHHGLSRRKPSPLKASSTLSGDILFQRQHPLNAKIFNILRSCTKMCYHCCFEETNDYRVAL